MSTRPYEYLDHTADIQFHSWGATLKEAFENMALAMFDYVTELPHVDIDESLTHDFEVTGQDLESLLFNFMDELLYQFSADFFTVKEIHITTFDKANFRIVANIKGETFSREKHPMGTEIKAMTYSNMQIHEKDDKSDIFIIMDI